MMTYDEATSYLYQCAPAFHQVGPGAYKEGLANTWALDEHFGHPHRQYRTIHVTGTNGKGSCSHTLAAILQSAGYRVGLYTSPHLLDFSERIRINGKPIDKDYVAQFVERERGFFAPLHPSFFEVTTALAFQYFADCKVDVAVIEVGLGGRLDCTNIITPDLSIITNISLEHTALLGNTLQQIAGEKAGIIKPGVPAVIGEAVSETKPVFLSKADELEAPVSFAETEHPEGYSGIMQMQGLYQQKNARTILTAIDKLLQAGYRITDENIREGFAHVCEMTGLMGRWQRLQLQPELVCDIGHNPGGLHDVINQLKQQRHGSLHIVIGFVNDKDIRPALSQLPADATYYFTMPSVSRALDSHALTLMARCYGLQGMETKTVKEAVSRAIDNASSDDFIFVGGSNFVVADLLSYWKETGRSTDVYFSSSSSGM